MPTTTHHTRRRASLIGLVTLSLGMSAVVVGIDAAGASAAGYSITSSVGANIRSAPSVSSTIVRRASNGAAVDVTCQIAGDRFGSGSYPDNRTWDRLSDGTYVHDVLVTTPGGVRENLAGGGYAYWTPSLPRCGAAAPAPTPVTPPPVTVMRTYQVSGTGGVGVRLRNTPRMADVKGVGPGEGASFQLKCQAWGEAVGGYANRVWDYIVWNGQEGYIPDTYTNTPTVANQMVPGVPQCGATVVPVQPPSTSAVDAAVNWALSKQGVTSYDYWCLKFSLDAYRIGANVPKTSADFARLWWDQRPTAQHRGDFNAPKGALVFWSAWLTLDGIYRDWGHVAISLGDGRVVTTYGPDGVRGVHIMNINVGSGRYLGWIMP